MNQKKIKKQINKINSFFDSITDDNEISKIEKDLLLSYVRKLYESILDEKDKADAKPEKEVTQSNPSPKATKKVSKKEVKAESESISVRKPFERAEPTSTEVEEVVIEPAAKLAEPIVPDPVPQKVAVAKLSENMASIFEKSEGTEISDRLSSLPLKDLTKAMGINERMFTIKELFGGDQDKFKSCMSELNKLGGYEEAKNYLLNGVAKELEWDSESNYKKADKFVKLVQRRFS